MSFDDSKWSVSSHSQVKRNRDKNGVISLTITESDSAMDSPEEESKSQAKAGESSSDLSSDKESSISVSESKVS